MYRHRLVSLLPTMFVACLLTSLMAETSAAPPPELQFFLAEDSEREGMTEARVQGSDRILYLHPEPFAGRTEIARVCFQRDDSGTVSIECVMTSEGAAALSKASAGHLGKPIAVVLDGKVITAPTVRDKISERALIQGRFSREEVVEIMSALVW